MLCLKVKLVNDVLKATLVVDEPRSHDSLAYLLCSSQHINNRSNLTPNSEGSLMAQMVTNPPAMQETQVQSPGWEDPLEKGMATHASILAWRIPWIEEPDGLPSMGWQTVRRN